MHSFTTREENQPRTLDIGGRRKEEDPEQIEIVYVSLSIYRYKKYVASGNSHNSIRLSLATTGYFHPFSDDIVSQVIEKNFFDISKATLILIASVS